MTDFADEARSREARLLRMAAGHTDDPVEEARLRAQILDYAQHTPEPPNMTLHGLSTRGCPKCDRTMWHQRSGNDHYWVCASCGHVEDLVMTCPTCGVLMKPPITSLVDRWSCPSCGVTAASGESAQEILRRDDEVERAKRMLDEVIAERNRDQGGDCGPEDRDEGLRVVRRDDVQDDRDG
ncbi:hypothetical protein [Streptomyces daliensis]